MSALDPAAVSGLYVGRPAGEPEAFTRVFHVGEIVRVEAPLAVEEGGYLVGEVVPTPASFEGTGRTLAEFEAAVADPKTVWVQFRRVIRYPQPVPSGDLERLDVPLVASTVLDLLAKAGIRVARHEFGISDAVAALICDDDDNWPGMHEWHANALVLWFEDMDDVHALCELCNYGPDEFDCSWPSVYGDKHMDDPEWDFPIIRAVHLADLPDLADLVRRELAGEFGGTEGGIRRRWLHRSAVQAALLTVASEAVRVVIFGHPLGWLGWLALTLAAVPLGRAFWLRYRDGAQPPRTHLDAVRRRSGRTGPDHPRGSGPR